MIAKKKLYILLAFALVVGYAWLAYNIFVVNAKGNDALSVCIIKSTTGIPCPSCGTTRSTLELFKGHLLKALYYNPLGLLIASILLVAPFWLLYDVLLGKSTFYAFYGNAERVINRRAVAYTLIALMLANWIWNIYKYI